MTGKQYTAELSKGQGMIEETIALLNCWEPGMTVSQLKEKVRQNGIIDRATALRVEDIVGRLFALRYMGDDGGAAKNLKLLLNLDVPVSALTQIFFLYTARAHVIFHDFVCDTYWGKYSAGATYITRQDALGFVERAKNVGLIDPPWSESTTVRIARYLGTALMNFGLAGKDRSGKREIQSFTINNLTTLYLAHSLHFTGISDNGILESRDWKLFGLEPMDVYRQLARISGNHFIVQFSGDLLRMSWKYKTMEDALRAIVETEL
jgi:hypothetical protein